MTEKALVIRQPLEFRLMSCFLGVMGAISGLGLAVGSISAVALWERVLAFGGVGFGIWIVAFGMSSVRVGEGVVTIRNATRTVSVSCQIVEGWAMRNDELWLMAADGREFRAVATKAGQLFPSRRQERLRSLQQLLNDAVGAC